MSSTFSDTAEMDAVLDAPRLGTITGRPLAPRRLPAAPALPTVGATRMAALRDCWQALWMSRLLVWAIGIGAVLTLGIAHTGAYDPPGVTDGFGWLGNLLTAPAARWDGVWFLTIAHHGYALSGQAAARAAFYPVYPLAMSALGALHVPLVLAGVLVSLVAFAAALYGLHRLTELELGSREAARGAVLLLGLFPMAFYFSAVYSESLYLALSIGVLWSARRGRFALACVLACVAGATRNTGVLLALPIAILYLYGPREDRPPDRPAARGWRPRYRVRRDAAALALVPVGMLAFMGAFAVAGGSALLPFHAQGYWHRHLAGPIVGIWQGAVAAFDGLRQLLSMQSTHVYFHAGHGNALIGAQHNLIFFLFLCAAVPAIVGALRRLPFAYGAYTVAALIPAVSYPIGYQPLMSLPRFVAVLFPLFMWGGLRLRDRPRLRTGVRIAAGLCIAGVTAQFATWHWVA